MTVTKRFYPAQCLQAVLNFPVGSTGTCIQHSFIVAVCAVNFRVTGYSIVSLARAHLRLM